MVLYSGLSQCPYRFRVKLLVVENTMLQIQLLGQFDIHLADRRILIPLRAGHALAAYPASTSRTAHRSEKLAGILWPDFAEDTARKNLRHECGGSARHSRRSNPPQLTNFSPMNSSSSPTGRRNTGWSRPSGSDH
jgi:hypothetical protein